MPEFWISSGNNFKITLNSKEYLYNQKDESSSVTGTVQSKVRELQQDEVDAWENIKKNRKIIQTKTRIWTSTNWIEGKIQNGNISVGW